MYFVTGTAVVAGVCLAFGVLYLFVGLRRASLRLLNLLFAGFALAYAGAIITARQAFAAGTAAEFLAPYELSLLFAAVAFSLFVWFVAEYTDVKPKPVLWVITVLWAVFAAVVLMAPDLLVGPDGGEEILELPWGELIRLSDQDDGSLFALTLVAQLLVFGYVVAADLLMFRRGRAREAAVLSVGTGWFLLMIVEENLAVAEILDFAPLADFGFLGFLLGFGFAMADEAVQTERKLLSYQANLAAMVAERTAQLEQAQAQLLEQAELEATVAERSRLARELHDVVTQLLFSINLVASSLPRLWRTDPEMAERTTAELQRLTKGALAEMRTLLRELRPHTIVETDLAILVTQLTDGLAARHDIPADKRIELSGSLPPDVHLALYRITQEAITNVAKHANASSLAVDLAGDEHRVHLALVDDGAGYDAAAIRSGSMGLGIMRERAAEIGAGLTVTTAPGAGTTVDVIWQDEGDG